MEEVSSAAKIKLLFSASEGDTNPELQEDSHDESQEEIGTDISKSSLVIFRQNFNTVIRNVYGKELTFFLM